MSNITSKSLKYTLITAIDASTIMINPDDSKKKKIITDAVSKIDNIIKTECRLGNDEFILQINDLSLFKILKNIIDSSGYITRAMNVNLLQSSSSLLFVTWNNIDKPISVIDINKMKKFIV